MNWISGPIVTIFIFVAGIMAQLIALHVDHYKLRKEVETMATKQDTLKESTDRHWADSTRHIDPIRDGASQKALMRRMERIEEKLDEVLTNQRNRRKQQGDSDDE